MAELQVSIVIPCYNSAKFIDTTLQAVFNSTYKDFEVLVIDDGSTDGTKKVLQEKGWIKKVRYVYQENKGIAGARNAGITIAQGKYISLLDHDDQPLPEKLERMVSYLNNHPEFKMAYSPCIIERIDKGGERYKQGIYSSHTPRWLRNKYEGDLFENLFYMRILITSVLMYKEAALAVGLFDETFKVCEDLEFYLRFGAQYRIGFIKEPCNVHIEHFSNSSKHFADLYPTYAILAYNRHYQSLKKKSSRAEKIYRERMTAAYRGLADVSLKNDNRKGARKYAVDAIRMNPYHPKYYFKMFKTWL
ncbi:MAG: glycosyltransferase family 2 protein [Deltaproteobacteria bacterium]|nr:glycosyltransferase family 2 protein [Deltaproteobacteria bacterium]